MFQDPLRAAACQTRINACETKVGLYHTYMAQLGAGVTLHQLPALYREVLQPFYPGVNLANWRFGFGDQQPPDNATTDCSVTYFNHSGYVNELRNGRLDQDSQWRWLFHELRHCGQCLQVGGRDAYAKMWFGHLEVAFIQDNDLQSIHGRMLMERDAFTGEARVFSSTGSVRDINNRLVRAIGVRLVGPRGILGDRHTIRTGVAYRLEARVTGGSDPLQVDWTWRVPGSSTFTTVPSVHLVNDGGGLEFVPRSTGLYEIRARVHQPGSNLRAAMRQVTFDALPRRVRPGE